MKNLLGQCSDNIFVNKNNYISEVDKQSRNFNAYNDLRHNNKLYLSCI